MISSSLRQAICSEKLSKLFSVYVMHVQGTSYGAPCELENVLAKIVIDRVPCIEMVRFVNSGTEACLSVLRLMRAYTKRDKVRPSVHPQQWWR